MYKLKLIFVAHFSKLYSDVYHVYIIGDFGRTATFDFCKIFIDEEKRIIQEMLGGKDFYDEYRRTMLTIHSYLPMIKEKQISNFYKSGNYINDSILIGFPDGMSINTAIEKLCVMLISFLQNKDNISTKKVITLPCNTLSPALLKIKEFVNDFDQITKLAERHKLTITKRDVQHIVENDSLEFVTVAEAVINYVTKNKYDFVLPLGTSGITNIYMNEISRTKSKIKLIEVSEKLQDFVFKTITASISNSEVEIKKQTQNIKNEIGIIKQQYKGSIAIIEACTDLNMGIGIVSLKLYAEYIASSIYFNE